MSVSESRSEANALRDWKERSCPISLDGRSTRMMTFRFTHFPTRFRNLGRRRHGPAKTDRGWVGRVHPTLRHRQGAVDTQNCMFPYLVISDSFIRIASRSSCDERRTASEDGIDQIEKLVRRRCPGLRLAHACDARIVVALDMAVRTGVHVRVDHPVQYVPHHFVAHLRDVAVMHLPAGVLDLGSQAEVRPELSLGREPAYVNDCRHELDCGQHPDTRDAVQQSDLIGHDLGVLQLLVDVLASDGQVHVVAHPLAEDEIVCEGLQYVVQGLVRFEVGIYGLIQILAVAPHVSFDALRGLRLLLCKLLAEPAQVPELLLVAGDDVDAGIWPGRWSRSCPSSSGWR